MVRSVYCKTSSTQLSVYTCDLYSPTQSQYTMDKRIVIIGAGASGIAAGTRLLEAGHTNVTVLEAEQRIGGRVNTVPHGKVMLDMGAQWCHGQDDNVVYQMAKDHDLLESSVMSVNSYEYIQSDGTHIAKAKGARMIALMDLLEISKDEAAAAGSGKSVGELLIAKCADLLQSDEYRDLLDADLSAQFLQSVHHMHNVIDASDSWLELAPRGYADYEECAGNQTLAWKGRGYRTVFDLLLRKIPAAAEEIPLMERIQFGKTVQLIDWSEANSGSAVRIDCSDGTHFEADHVIWTGSLGVLRQRHTTLFTPALPERKVNAIRAQKLGTVAKLYIEFAESFWPEDWTGFSTLWRPQEIEQLRADGDDWLLYVCGVYRVDYHPNMLCGWVTGAAARHMAALPEAEVSAALVRLLRMFLQDRTVPEPIAFKRSQWDREENFLGSYSYATMLTDELQVGRSDLAEPLLRRQLGAADSPVLQFAGEATSDKHFSTVHGAIETGWREADRLIELYKTTTTTTSVIYDVLVLGAGLAGLGAAMKFHGTDKTFLILEGHSKAGGRVNTRNLLAEDVEDNVVSDETFNDGTAIDPVNFVDSGAQWLHGKCNRLHTVAERHGLLTDEQSEEGLGAFIRDDGVVLDAYLVKKTDFLVGQILTECEKYARPSAPDTSRGTSNENTAISYPSSVSSFLLEHFQPYLDSIGDVDERQQAGQLLDWHVRFQVIDNSCLTLDDVSAKSWGKYSYNGESCQAHYNFRTGFSSAVAALVDEIGYERFRFSRDIVEICVEENGTTLCVRCADGEQFRTRHVVCTFSMGSLKHGIQRQLFRPPLPASCERAIADIGFETINKLFLQFAEPWWGDLDGIQLVFKSDHYETDGWTRHISGFDVMRPGPEHTLLAWVGGHGARDMELLSDAQIVNDCVALLAQFTGRPVPAPIRHFCTRWHTNRFVRGAYSYISTSCDRNGTDSGSLARPVTVSDMWRSRREQRPHGGTEAVEAAEHGGDDNNDGDERPLIVFAGEAIHDQYFSTAHGAFLSGIEQATKIDDFYRIA